MKMIHPRKDIKLALALAGILVTPFMYLGGGSLVKIKALPPTCENNLQPPALDSNGNLTLSSGCVCWDSNDITNPYRFRNLTIEASATLTVCNGGTGQLYIEALETFTNNGIIDLAGRAGMFDGVGPGLPIWVSSAFGVAPPTLMGGAGGMGGKGGNGGENREANKGQVGGAGGSGGNGGTWLINGSPGNSGSSGGAGGAGEKDEGANGESSLGAGGSAVPGGVASSGQGHSAGLIHVFAKIIVNDGVINLKGEIGSDAVDNNNGNNGSNASVSGECSATGGGKGVFQGNSSPGTGIGWGEAGSNGGGAGGGAHLKHYLALSDHACAAGGGSGLGAGGGGQGGGAGGLLIFKAAIINLINYNDIIAGTGGLLGGNGGRGGNSGVLGGAGGTQTENPSNGAAGGDGGLGGFHEEGSSDDKAWGGGGGGGGGSGGGGARGANGKAFFVYTNECTNCQNIPEDLKLVVQDLTPPAIGDFAIVRHVSDTDYLLDNIDYVSGWINNRGMRKLHTGSVTHWFELNQIRIGDSNTQNFPKRFKIAEAFYHIYQFDYDEDKFESANLGNMYFLLNGRPFDYKYGTNNFYRNNTDINDGPIGYENTSVSGSLYSSTGLPIFKLPDGINKIGLTTRTNGFIDEISTGEAQKKINLDQNENQLYAFLVDQYAPCDNANTVLHSCHMQLHDVDGGHLLTKGSSSGKVQVRLQIIEGDGSGIYSDGSTDNIRLFLARQHSDPGGSFLAMPDNINNRFDFTFNSVKDKDCQEIIDGNFYGSSVTPFPVSSTKYLPAADGFMKLDLDLAASNFAEGTYWVFACLKDRAGNWSFIIDPQNSALMTWPNDNYMGKALGSRAILSMFNPNNSPSYDFLGNDVPNVLTAWLPPLYKRFIFDKADPDFSNPGDNSVCLSDPCRPLILSPPPAFKTPGETNLRIAFSPADYSSASKIKVGIKLPPDKSGLEKVHFKMAVGSLAIDDQYLNDFSVTQSDPAACADIIAANNALDSLGRTAGWVDFCFEIDTAPAASVFVWLTDGAGNNNFQTALSKRDLLVDNIAPTKPANLTSTPNPTSSTSPTFTFTAATDNYQVAGYKICYWEAAETFGLAELNNLAKGVCPQSAQVNGRVASVTDLINWSGNGSEIFTFPAVNQLKNGRWHFAAFSLDIANNASEFSNLFELVISDGNSFLDFPANVYVNTNIPGVVPQSGTSGFYRFSIKYTDLGNLPPSAPGLIVDINGDGVLSANETVNMTLDPGSGNDGDYTNGEIFSRSLFLEYPSSSSGVIKYRFEFYNSNGQAGDGFSPGDALKTYQLTLDPYDASKIEGMLQVRNNLQKSELRLLPVILLQQPEIPQQIVSCTIHDLNGNVVKQIVVKKPYNQLERYYQWDLTDESGRNVPNGIYLVIYNYGKKIAKDHIVVLR